MEAKTKTYEGINDIQLENIQSLIETLSWEIPNNSLANTFLNILKEQKENVLTFEEAEILFSQKGDEKNDKKNYFLQKYYLTEMIRLSRNSEQILFSLKQAKELGELFMLETAIFKYCQINNLSLEILDSYLKQSS